MAYTQIGHRLAADLALVDECDIRAHLPQHAEDAIARGIEADVLNHQVAAGHDAGGDGKERRRGWIARHFDIAGVQIGGAVDADDPRAIILFHAQFGTEAAQHTFGMVACGDRFDHTGDAGRVEACQQHRALDLRAGDREAVFDRYGGLEALHHQRQGAAGGGGEAGPHLRQRIDHPAHRAL